MTVRGVLSRSKSLHSFNQSSWISLEIDLSLHSFSNLYRSVPGKKVLSGWLEANASQPSSTAAHLTFVRNKPSPRTDTFRDFCILSERG